MIPHKEEEVRIEETCDNAVFQRVDKLAEDDRLLEAARCLRELGPKNLKKQHEKILKQGKMCEELIESIESIPDDKSWKKSKDGEVTVYYKIDPELITCKIESPIDKSLLCPLLSVLNETELFDTWIPNFTVPRFKVRRSVKLQQQSRVSQLILVSLAVPWPLPGREVVVEAVGLDDIDTNGNIFVMLEGKKNGDFIPPPEPKTVRVKFRGGFLFRKYTEDVVLASLYFTYDKSQIFLPHSFLNFLLKIAFGKIFKKFIKVAEDIRDGRRPKHNHAIQMKRAELYDWIDDRVLSLVANK